MLKGALHSHSTYSDGELTLSELRESFLAQGCSFLCITDHAEYFDEEKLKAYREECESLSDEKFRFVVGLEYSCEQRMHILGYGATLLAPSKDPQTVFRHIEAQDAISVIAHPRNESFAWIESFDYLPRGIETWNSKYDGRYAPRPETFALMQRLAERKPDLRAFYGQDLHWKKQFRGLFVHLSCQSNGRSEVLQALREGNFAGRKGEIELPSTGILPEALLAQFARAHGNSSRLWKALKQTKKALDGAGVKVPESIKSQLRRIF